MSFQNTLEKIGACEEAREWVDNKTLEEAWNTCHRADWMLWLAGEANVDRKLLVEAACRCAETTLHLVPEGEERPRRVVEVARKWVRGEATPEEVRGARAAYAARAAYHRHTSAATLPAYAAAYVAACAAARGYITANAAAITSVYAVRAGTDPQVLTDIVRQVIPLDAITGVL